MIERFYDPAEGVLEYMGTDVKLLNVHWYRDQIGFVGQEPTLFGESIAKVRAIKLCQNITLATIAI